MGDYLFTKKVKKMFRKSILVISAVFTLAACGGNSSAPNSAVTGQFKDSNTAGLSYVSGGQSGITGSDGSFIYEVGRTVTFSIGGITVGTSNGKSIVTPVDLVSDGSSDSIKVQNIVRFLMMLDSDGDPSNGINISPPVQEIAKNWAQVDFSVDGLPAELSSIISDAVSASGGTHTLPNAKVAKEHLEATLLCSYAGAYEGTYSGGDRGQFGFLVDASSGNVAGVSYSVPDVRYTSISGTTPISHDQKVTFVSGNTSDRATFRGQFTSVNEVTGEWQNDSYSVGGRFSGSRIGGKTNALHRFTGNYIGDDFGLFSFDVDSSNNVTGVAYSVDDDELSTVSGTLSGTALTATVSDGTTISGTLDTTTGGLNGMWSDSEDVLSGTFSGSGCRLN